MHGAIQEHTRVGVPVSPGELPLAVVHVVDPATQVPRTVGVDRLSIPCI